MNSAAYLSAEEAAAYLGVSRPTLYAYVSRGLVVSERWSGRSHRYPRTALDELKARRERRRDANLSEQGSLHWGSPVLDSALTLIADGRLWYRGHDARELSRTATLEEVACLLWTGTTDGADELFPASASPQRARSVGSSLADRLFADLAEQRAESAVALSEPNPAALRAAGRTIRRLFDTVGATGSGRLAARLARGWRAPSVSDLNAALILCADHELNASSFTARCVASTDAPLHNVLLAALCALEGRRHCGTTTEDVDDLLCEAERIGAPPACRQSLSRRGWIPGFGPLVHSFYPEGDPRADELLSRLAVPSREPIAQTIAFAREELGLYPSIEFALVALSRTASLPTGAAFTLFALGRSAGWVAHALEAATEGKLIRPRARYTGPLPSDPPR